MTDVPDRPTGPIDRTTLPTIAIVALQAIAAAYFLTDGFDDLIAQWRTGPDGEVIMETVVGIALVAGVVIGALHVRALVREARRNRSALASARGAMGHLIAARFAEWGLSSAEAEVALFALKGSTIAEIAAMRDAAEGTVRSQLSQVYAKAGVKSQAMLVALFIDDLIDPLLAQG